MSVQVAKRVAPLELCAAPAVKHSRPSHPGDAGGSAEEVAGASQEVLERTSITYEPMSRIVSASLGQIQVLNCVASNSQLITLLMLTKKAVMLAVVLLPAVVHAEPCWFCSRLWRVLLTA